MTTHPTSTAADPTSAEPDWALRYRAARVSLPTWAREAPERCLYRSNQSGVSELYAWDRASGSHRRVTDRPKGTTDGRLSPDGLWVWWFADTDGDEFGRWMREPFGGGQPAEPVAPDLPPAYMTGLALGDNMALIGGSTDDGTTIHVVRDGKSRLLYSSPRFAYLTTMSRDDTFAAVVHSEHDDSLHPAVRVVRVADGSTVADLWDGPGKGLEATSFAPVPGDTRLLVSHERRGRDEILVWDPVAGTERELHLDLPGAAHASWYPDGRALVVRHDHAGRTELYRYDLDGDRLTRLVTPNGVVTGATARPDGVWFDWSSSAEPPVIREVGGGPVLTPPGDPAPAAAPITDGWVDGVGGRIHALVSSPAGATGPLATVFHIHGGPESHDADAFRPGRAMFTDNGYRVIHVNYRGSTGYGSAWRDALVGRPGLTELEDIAAVRAWAIAEGLTDPDRCVLMGGSWGGYLTLLGLGTKPDLWATGVAIVPVADYVAAYADSMEPLRESDRAIFGGSPDEVPELYERCSPLTYIESVRVPVLVLAGVNDPRCPIQQIENYLDRLTELGAVHEVYRFDAGHGSVVVDEQIRQAGLELDFVRRHVAP